MVLYLQKNVCRLCIKYLAMAVFVCMLCSCHLFDSKNEELPYYNAKELTPQWGIKNPHTIANFNFQNQSGNSYSTDSLRGKIYVANFFFTTCPGICPKMTHNLKKLQDSILSMQQVNIVSFSVMPWVDTVGRLKKYGIENEINPSVWHLLTGDKKAVYTLGRGSYFADENNTSDTSSFLHTDKMFLVDKEQHIRGVYNATRGEDINRVLNDIKILLKD